MERRRTMDEGGEMGGRGSGVNYRGEFYLRSNYRLGKAIGYDAFAKVIVAEHELTGYKVAVKKLNREKIRAKGAEEIKTREIKISLEILRLLTHPHIIHVYEVVQTPTDTFVVMEYTKRGELYDYIIENGRLQEDEARRYFQQIVSGVEYLHLNMVVHRDLSPENLFLDAEKCNVKIGGFGFSNVMRDGYCLRSPNYAAPELLSEKWYAGPEVDVWNCGVILYALLTAVLPFDDENIANVYKKIKSGIYILPSHLSPGARDLISGMLRVDPLQRVTIPEIRQHPWFQTRLPRYLAVPSRNAGKQARRIDDHILNALIGVGFDKNELIESLRHGVQNRETVAYYLMLDNTWNFSRLPWRIIPRREKGGCAGELPVCQKPFRRISHGYIGEEFQEEREEVEQASSPFVKYLCGCELWLHFIKWLQRGFMQERLHKSEAMPLLKYVDIDTTNPKDIASAPNTVKESLEPREKKFKIALLDSAL